MNMRIFSFLLLLFTFSFTLSLYAQTPPPIEDAAIEEKQEETIFSRASDEELAEAQKFYRHCTDNETMRAQKDCKCAATAYLETRLTLGSAATINQIMTHNINRCLKDEKRSTIDAPSDVSEVTDAQLKEADEMFTYCKGDPKLSRFYDCECFAARFLDGRLKQGPIVSKEILILGLKNQCRNIIETTGYEYSRCMIRTKNKVLRNNIQPKAYCECYARKWADLFESYDGNITIRSKSAMKERARAYCRKPIAYEQ